MKVVMMAGGEGTRLRPLTTTQPKPMLPLANRPMAEHIINLLKKHGFTQIIITVAFMAESIRRYFGDGSEFGVEIIYATEENPLGTAGSVGNIRDLLDERFMVISGDVLTDIDLGSLQEYHESTNSICTLALKRMENPLEFGIVITDEDGKIERFLEKPSWGQVFSDTINTGIYIFEPEVFDWIPKDKVVDFSGEVFPKMLEDGARMYGYIADGYWEDVGTLETYLTAHHHILEKRVDLEISGFTLREDVFVGEGAEIDPTATISGPALIGPNCRVGPGVTLGPYCVLGANVRIGAGSDLERTIVYDNCYIGDAVTARLCVIGRSCEIRSGSHLGDGVILGDVCQIGEHAIIGSGVKIYPNKMVESGAAVNSSIVYETKATRNLFTQVGVVGLANVDLSPELATKLALSYASTILKGSTVIVSRDSSRAARMLKRAIMVGLNSAGLHVEDLEVATIPMTRFQIRSGLAHGGITIRLSTRDPQAVIIRFFDSDGIDLDETAQRKIERVFYREEMRRVLANEIGDIEFPGRTVEAYTTALSQHVNLVSIRAAKFKLILDYASGTASFLMPNILAKLGADTLVVNPVASTIGVLSFDRIRHGERISELVKASGANLGAIIDPEGETLTLIDDKGRMLTPNQLMMCFSYLVASKFADARIVVPISTTWAINQLMTDLGATVIWSKLGSAHLMDAAISEQAHFVADANGGYGFPGFLPAFDAVASLLYLLSMLSESDTMLSSLLDKMPGMKVMHQEVSTPFEQKGALMRTLLADLKDVGEVVLVDGIKIIDPLGWVLAVPDSQEPVTHVFAESTTEADAIKRLNKLVKIIDKIVTGATT